MKKSFKIGAMSLLLVLVPVSLGVGTIYSSSGGNTDINEETTVSKQNNAVGVDESIVQNASENTAYFSDIYPIGNNQVRVWYRGELN